MMLPSACNYKLYLHLHLYLYLYLPSACNPVEWRASLKILMILNVFTILVIFHSRKYWAVLLSSSAREGFR